MNGNRGVAAVWQFVREALSLRTGIKVESRGMQIKPAPE
jgi:hypothetical protein